MRVGSLQHAVHAIIVVVSRNISRDNIRPRVRILKSAFSDKKQRPVGAAVIIGNSRYYENEKTSYLLDDRCGSRNSSLGESVLGRV